MKLDLHMHSVASDGVWTPERLVAGAMQGGLDVIALTDHDTATGVPAAIEAARGHALEVIPGCELSSTHEGEEVHVLGYWVDPEAPVLQAHQDMAESLRLRRIERMVEHLRSDGIDVTLEAVLEVAGPRRSMLARPHLARVLVDAGYATSIGNAFDRYIADDRPYFLPTALAEPVEVVRTIVEAGGVPVWAHPPADLMDVLLESLIEAGLRGLEIYRPSHSPSYTDKLRALAERHGLVVSGGSDWHNPEKNGPLGTFSVTDEQVGDLLALGGVRLD